MFGGQSRHEKAADKYRSKVEAVNVLADELKSLSDEDLKQRVTQYKGKDWGEIEKNIAEIFAGIREASDRVLEMRHFDVQILGGFALLDSAIAEMKTGEGKTLVATLPLITAALTGKGAHLVTVNDYLAKRDADWMRPVYEFFDLSVGAIYPGQSIEEKREAYESDITYATNNELGFDYLRDNMVQKVEGLVQKRGLHFAIVDEVDSILIDEARTPLIISAPDTESTELYQQFSRLVPALEENNHYNIDEKRKAATLTEDGVSKVEQMLGVDNLYEDRGVRFVHHLEQALRANTLYHKDKDYVVQNGQVVIVDEFTGRLMEGRRYAEGLHQALEAKEGVTVQQESRTLATITFQNFFRLYDRLAGMTGTAETSAEEFEGVYNLDVVVIPTNKVLARMDKSDYIYTNESGKFKAVVREIKERHEKGQPVLVGTIAIEKSEYLSDLLKREGVPHEVLNAKHHAREAEIVTNAGQRGAVTISTNMAGRGTDIKLGDGVPDLGGLYVIGTERHEARRIDNQLRGRSGRQGDPGETRFFVSMEDDVMRIFGGDRMQSLMQRLKVPEDEAIENKLVSRAIESAQERVEGHYFDMRKQVLSYDDVLNRQRNAIYGLRRALLEDKKWLEPNLPPQELHDHIRSLVEAHANGLVEAHTFNEDVDQWNVEEIAETVHSLIGGSLQELHEQLLAIVEKTKPDGPDAASDALTEAVSEAMTSRLDVRRAELGEDVMSRLEQAAALRAIDTYWMEHLDTMDYLRTGIGLRGYGQRDPLVEYQKEGHRLFQQLLTTIKGSIIEVVFKAEAVKQEQQQGVASHKGVSMHEQASGAPAQGQPQQEKAITSDEPIHNPNKDVGRNDPCPCGSGLKYKKCGLIGAPQHKG